MSFLTTEKKDDLANIFKMLGVRPRLNFPDSFRKWTASYCELEGLVRPKSEVVDHTTSVSGCPPIPRLSLFSGHTGSAAKGDTPYDQCEYEVPCVNRKVYIPNMQLVRL